MKYDGGKNGPGVYQRLICMMPPHTVYVEMFLGSGAILRRKRPAALSLAYELDRATIRDIAEALPADRFEPSRINADWIYPGELPGNGGTSLVFHEPGTMRRNLEVFNVDAFDAIRRKFLSGCYFWATNDPAETLIYCDPPYPDSVRSSKGKIYQNELLADQEHADLYKLLLAIPAKIMLSGYDNEIYNSLLKGWRKETIPTVNRAGKKVIETVWLNFPAPIELHDYSHVGQNHRERWNMTKRLRNWTGQLEAMEPAERGAMLSALSEAMEAFHADGRKRDEDAARSWELKAARNHKKLSPEILTPEKASADRLFEK